jgi:DNA-binding NtrC family response regulator
MGDHSQVSRILILDDEPDMVESCRRILERGGHDCLGTSDPALALAMLETDSPDVVVTDLRMPGMDGLEMLRRARELDSDRPVIMLTAFATVESAVAAVKAGAFDYLPKPFSLDQLTVAVERAAAQRNLMRENRNLREQLHDVYGFEKIIGRSDAIERVLDFVRRAARTEANILIFGESGTGKELIARSIHYHSPRKEQPFIVLNCAALSEGVLESELFGHDRGAFSGALASKQGRFERADQGTLFIDEVGEMSLTAQVKLLRVLQEHEFERVGGTRTIKVDVRLVTATNKNLEEQVRKGLFREDLYYRLNVVNIHLPPLRERREDIESLVMHFLRKYAAETGKRISGITAPALGCLLAYDWPGNVRELENVMERAVVLAKAEELTPLDFPQALRRDQDQICLSLPERGGRLNEILEELERQLLLQTLEREEWSQTRAAETLGIKRTTLRYKMEKYRLLNRCEPDQDHDPSPDP